MHSDYRVSFPAVKRPGRGVYHTPQSSAEVKGRAQICLYSPSVPALPVLRWTFLHWTLRDFRLPSRCKLDLRSAGMLHWVDWWVSTFRDNLSGLQTLLTNYQSMLDNIPEERRFLHWKLYTELCLLGIGECQIPQAVRRPVDSSIDPHIDPSGNRENGLHRSIFPVNNHLQEFEWCGDRYC